jgi:L-iditol 2-dehydrogenase
MTQALPDQMWACVLHGKEDVRLERVPVPAPGPGEIVIRVAAALTCGTDVKVFTRGYHSRMIVPPALFGHEFSGAVAASRSDRFPPGTMVVAANSAPCGTCFFCGIGRPNLCRDLLFVNGAYAEFLRVPARIVEKNCHVVPAHVHPVAAALVEPLACAIKGVADAGIRAGESVLVIGAGPLGLMLARVATLAGAVVTSVDADPARLAVARELGVAHTVAGALTAERAGCLRGSTEPHGLGYDCVIEAIGRPETWHAACDLVRPGGRVNLFGGCPQGTELRLDATRLHYEEIALVASFHHTPETVAAALDLIAGGGMPAFALVREGRSLFDVPELLRALQKGSASPKTAVFPDLTAGVRLSGDAVRRAAPA